MKSIHIILNVCKRDLVYLSPLCHEYESFKLKAQSGGECRTFFMAGRESIIRARSYLVVSQSKPNGTYYYNFQLNNRFGKNRKNILEEFFVVQSFYLTRSYIFLGMWLSLWMRISSNIKINGGTGKKILNKAGIYTSPSIERALE